MSVEGETRPAGAFGRRPGPVRQAHGPEPADGVVVHLEQGAPADLRRTIGFWSGIALLMGTMIGGGIFRAPASIAAALHSPGPTLLLWVAFGVVTLCGALTLAELATMMPRTGGIYVFLRAAYGDAAAFVFGWLYLLAAIPSGMAALAVIFGELALRVAGTPPAADAWGIPLLAIAAIVGLSLANIAGVRSGTRIQNFFAVVKIGVLVVLIASVFALGRGDVSRWFTAAPAGDAADDFLAAVKSILFTYNGWVYISLVAGELQAPDRHLVRVIVAGTGGVIAIYLLANLAYFYLLPVTEMAGTVVAREAMLRVAGPVGANLLSLGILASIFGALNGVILTKSRVAFALARDGLSFALLGRAHPRFATPHASIAIQGAMAVTLVLVLRDPAKPLRLFDRLTAYFVMVEWLALLFAIAAVFVLRRKRPADPRPYRTWGYPWVPLIFIGGTVFGLTAVLWSSVAKGDYAPLVSLGIVAAGFPAHAVWRRRKVSSQTA